jgi:C1A family cysteine protease
LNHAIGLVGYTSSKNAWLVKNSWGTGWGRKGFALISNTEGNGTCGMNMDLSYPVRK